MATMIERLKTEDPLLCVTAPMLRKKIRDLPRYNEIVKHELSDDELVQAIIDAIASFNGMSPFFSSYSSEDFPDRSLLLEMSICEAYDQLVLWHGRQELNVQDAGLQVPIHENWKPIAAIVDRIRVRTADRAAKLKTQLNVQRALGGGVSSPLWLETHWL
jgi:hypothetical protein